MKQIPNIFTLLNLLCGCIAIIYIVQPGLIALTNADGDQSFITPEQAVMGSLFIGMAAVIDFLDGFVARLFKATSELGKQLDSLADVVSFGVAPGMILFQFLKMSYAQQENGLDTNLLFIIPAFIVPCAGAYRLARFNIDTQQSHGFKGVPIPAAGLLIASLPLIFWTANNATITHILINKSFLYGVILVVSYLMVSTLPMMALKFKNFGVKDNWPKFLLVGIAVLAGIFLQWLAVPVVFIIYVLLSLLLKPKA